MQSWEIDLERWQRAGVLDAGSADRVRAFEAEKVRPDRSGWQVKLALILGGVLLAAGVLLLVASHWDDISPVGRVCVALVLLASLHGGGVLAADRFPALATALHGVGTVGAGAAIATVGQVFNMQEHWPGAVLLWTLCAASGWWWLRDEFQQVCCMLLAPAWIICEWIYRADRFRGSEVYLGRMVGVLAAAYLVGVLHTRKRMVHGVLFGLSGVALAFSVGMLSQGWRWAYDAEPFLPSRLRGAALGLMLVVVIGVWFSQSVAAVPVGVALGMVFALPWLRTTVRQQNEFTHRDWTTYEPSLMAYALVAAVAAFFAWWGLRQRSRALLNYGIAMFALAVTWFYFSSLMDKLGRSLGLIGLGVLFLLGGWLLERLRRRLLGEIGAAAVEGMTT